MVLLSYRLIFTLSIVFSVCLYCCPRLPADVRRNALFVHTKKTRELKKYVPVIRGSWQATARRIWNDISGETRDYKVFGSQILGRNFATRMMEFCHRGKVCQDMSAAQFETELARLMNTSTETLKTNYLCVCVSLYVNACSPYDCIEESLHSPIAQ